MTTRAEAIRCFDAMSTGAWDEFRPRKWTGRTRADFRAAISEGRVDAATVVHNVAVAEQITALEGQLLALYGSERAMPVARKRPGVKRDLRAVTP